MTHSWTSGASVRRFERSEPTTRSTGLSAMRRILSRAAVGLVTATTLVLFVGSGTARAGKQIIIYGSQAAARICSDQIAQTNPKGVYGYWCETFSTNVSVANELYGWYWWGTVNVYGLDNFGSVLAHTYCHVGGTVGTKQNGTVVCPTGL
jgi:hypothetical protein